MAPDVIFDDKSFHPLLPASTTTPAHPSSMFGSSDSDSSSDYVSLQQLLLHWDPSEPHVQLSLLLQLLLRLYAAHQRTRIAARADDRLQFELGMVDSLHCEEMLLSDSKDAVNKRACFAIPIRDISFAAAEKAFGYWRQQLQPCWDALPQQPRQQPGRQHQPGSSSADATAQLTDNLKARSPATSAPAAAIAASEPPVMDTSFKLHAAFRVGAGASQSMPDLTLQVSHDDCQVVDSTGVASPIHTLA